MRYLIILFLISLLPFQKIEASISIDTIKTAEEIDSKYGRDRINKSLTYYQLILSGSDNNDKLVKSFCYLQMGTLHYYVENNEKAKFYLDKTNSKALKRSVADSNIISRIYKLSTDLNYINRNFKETILAADTGILFQTYLQNPDSLLLCDLYYLKASSLKMQENFKQSISCIKKSLTYLRTSSSKQNWRRANNYKSMGGSYSNMNYYRLALKYFYKALNLYNPNSPSNLLASTYYYIGSINSSLGDYKLAEKNLKKAIEIYDEIYNGKHFNYTYYYNSLASAYKNLSETDSAFLYYHKSIQSANGYNLKTISLRYRNLAELYFKNNDLKNAEKHINKSIESADNLFDPMSHYRGEVYQFAAKYYIETDNLIKGYEFLETAFKIAQYKADERTTDLAECYKILSSYHLKNEDFENALIAIQKALIAISSQFNDLELLSNPSHLDGISKKSLYSYLLWKANIINESINNNNKIDLIQQLQIQRKALLSAADVANSIRLSLLSQEGKYWLTANNKEVYHLIIKNALALYSYTNDKEHLISAFEASERSKAGILLDLMNDAKLKDLNHLPDSILIKDQQLNDIKKTIEFKLHKTKHEIITDQKVIKKLQYDLFRINQKIQAHTTFTNQNFSSFNQAKFTIELVLLDSLQRNLNNKQVLLEYYLFDNNLYGIAITRNDIQIQKLNLDQEFYKNINSVVNYIRHLDYDVSSNGFNKFRTSSNKLYRKIVQPFEDILLDKELIIIPDDILLNLPFEVLITDLNKSSLNTPSYLILSNPIHYAYSTALLNFKSLKAPIGRNQVLAFAPDYNYEDFQDSSQIQILPPLPNITREVNQIADHFNIKSFKSKAANKENFLDNVSDFPIIHLAMHTKIDDENPSFSELVFSPSTEEVYNLYTNEIYDLELNASLVLLSACNTGSGKILKGEGIMSFARAFLFAGCHSLTLTLWSINDNTSTELIGNYYKYLSEGRSKSKALQLAKIKYLESADPLKSHPYFWAAYIQIGNNKPINPEHSSQALMYYLSLLILSLVVFTFRKQLKAMYTKKGE
ncbi:MAG: hypothetical protein DRI84_08440 [Bacteroidetes bacterium]|nr:MAG: hypothetical protein DRI84_08440 [Bacteroidota bacterium]